MLRSIFVFSSLAVLLLLGPPPAAAQGEVRPCADQAFEVAGPASLESWVQAAAAGQPASISGPSAQSDCTADCWDGSTVTCSGSSCSAVDSACSSGERGYCTGTDTGTRYCPTCDDTCTAEVTCQSGATVQCTGSGPSSCVEYPGCWVQCDGQTVECPPPVGGGFPCPHPL